MDCHAIVSQFAAQYQAWILQVDKDCSSLKEKSAAAIQWLNGLKNIDQKMVEQMNSTISEMIQIQDKLIEILEAVAKIAQESLKAVVGEESKIAKKKIQLSDESEGAIQKSIKGFGAIHTRVLDSCLFWKRFRTENNYCKTDLEMIQMTFEVDWDEQAQAEIASSKIRWESLRDASQGIQEAIQQMGDKIA